MTQNFYDEQKPQPFPAVCLDSACVGNDVTGLLESVVWADSTFYLPQASGPRDCNSDCLLVWAKGWPLLPLCCARSHYGPVLGVAVDTSARVDLGTRALLSGARVPSCNHHNCSLPGHGFQSTTASIDCLSFRLSRCAMCCFDN